MLVVDTIKRNVTLPYERQETKDHQQEGESGNSLPYEFRSPNTLDVPVRVNSFSETPIDRREDVPRRG